MKFVPSVPNGVSDDTAVVFLATNSRLLKYRSGGRRAKAAYKGQSTIAFQTGTTAGTLTFTLDFVNTRTVLAVLYDFARGNTHHLGDRGPSESESSGDH